MKNYFCWFCCFNKKLLLILHKKNYIATTVNVFFFFEYFLFLDKEKYVTLTTATVHPIRMGRNAVRIRRVAVVRKDRQVEVQVRKRIHKVTTLLSVRRNCDRMQSKDVYPKVKRMVVKKRKKRTRGGIKMRDLQWIIEYYILFYVM